MGFYVHIHVAFACDDFDYVSNIAKKFLETAKLDQFDEKMFVNDMVSKSGEPKGPKGGLYLWGWIGNYTRVEEFCNNLKPLWKMLLADDDDSPFSHEHIIVFEEKEQKEHAIAYEILLNDKNDIEIRTHALPFAWMQY